MKLPILVSEIEHDYLHWPLREKHVFERWKSQTQWGRLFLRYEREGALRPPPAERG